MLLVVQIALCAVLVTSSLVAVRGLVRSLHSDFGFEPQNALLVNTDLNMAGYHGDQDAGDAAAHARCSREHSRSRRPWVVDYLPLGLGWNENSIYANSTTDLRESNKVAAGHELRCFSGILPSGGHDLVGGQAIHLDDDKKAPKVAVVNREFARKVFGSVAQAVGGYFKTLKDIGSKLWAWWRTESTRR